MDAEDDRTPPTRIRITRLQEVQLPTAAALSDYSARLHHAHGVPPEAAIGLSEVDIGRLTRNHDVLIAEADDAPVGLMIWGDQAPGIAWIEHLVVHPDYQRFGIATKLLRDVGAKAKEHGVGEAVIAVHKQAPWALMFLGVRGFLPVSARKPPSEVLAAWLAEHGAAKTGHGAELWTAATDGLGMIPGLPRPSTRPPSP
ncbi:MAG: GNAT family N-acetyltransferase [Myxococcota bacterium]